MRVVGDRDPGSDSSHLRARSVKHDGPRAHQCGGATVRWGGYTAHGGSYSYIFATVGQGSRLQAVSSMWG